MASVSTGFGGINGFGTGYVRDDDPRETARAGVSTSVFASVFSSGVNLGGVRFWN